MNQKKYPLHIQSHHFDEWVTDSGVSPKITTLNVRSLSIPGEIDDLLNRNPKSRWTGWKHGAGWAVSGVDPKTGEQIYNGAQFKPDQQIQRYDKDKPKFNKDGTPELIRYFNCSNEESAPLFLDTGEQDYRLNVIQDLTRWVLITEGAKKAGASLSSGIPCISIPGVGNGQKLGQLKKNLKLFCTVGRVIVLAFDSDMFSNVNVCRELDRLGRLVASEGATVKVLMLPRTTKAIDDYIVAYGYEAFKQLVEGAISFEEWRHQFMKREIQEIKTPIDLIPNVEESYQIKAQAALFSDRPWVSIDGQMYQWVGTHYEQRQEAVIKRMIADWCAATPVFVNEEWCYSYGTATHIENIYNWVERRLGVDPDSINPPGINCLNGVLQISWDKCTPHWELVKHNPSIIYTYVGEFEFNPNADPTWCDRLLACLDTPQREIFIKTLAASLDLQTIRRFRGRGIKALLCKGDGNNGKDSLREAVALLYGVGVVNCTVTDFEVYDKGRKFPLTKLSAARISWSSENSNLGQLDSLQSVKAAITGETLDFELKNQVERPMNPCCVFFFNINNVPNLQASLEAIKSRWAVLSFDKTFKVNADPSRGELEADSRFRYDPNFIKIEVVPALLNKMLAALPEVAMKAINYDCTESALEQIQSETNHLWAFAREAGLGYQVGGRVYINDLWERLKQWYLDNGTLLVSNDGKGKEKYEWHDQPRRGDKNVKAANQICQRFSELFPKVRKERDNSNPERKGQFYLSGLGFGGSDKILQPLAGEEQVANQVINLFQKLSLQEQEIVRQAINFEIKDPKRLHHASPVQLESESASPNASPSASLASPITITEPTISNQESHGSVATGIAENISVNNSKNFTGNSGLPNFRVGDRVLIDFPAAKRYHGKIGEIIRMKSWQGLELADVQVADEKRCFEAQLSWLHPATLEGEQQNLLE